MAEQKTDMGKLDRQRLRDAFAEYVSHYDISDEKIKLKIDHTYRVAALCERIAKSIGLSRHDMDVAWASGMLHDVGRFEQLRQYGTFSDADSIDHAHYGVQILFDEGKIKDYLPLDPAEEDYRVIRTAIWNHSAYRVEEGLSKRSRMFCDILRDADKVDILKVNYDVSIEVIYNVTTQELKQAEVTHEVMEQFLARHAILRSVKRTCVDHIVGHIALVFELVYPESVKVVRQQGYLDKLLGFESDNERTAEQFAQLRKCMEDYMKSC
jgi:putative nucleotidyltransferase with HDIG domain